MGLFGSSSPFDADVEKATSEENLNENWDRIIEICDKVGSSVQNARDCLKSIIKRLNHTDPHVVLHAITLLEACVKNCDKVFPLEVASRDFEQELSRLLKQKLQPKISDKLKLLLKSWAEDEFANNPQLSLIPSLYYKLKEEGMDFNIQPDPSNKGKKDSKYVDTKKLIQEEEDLKRAIELSLKDSKQQGSSRTSSTSSSLYPSAGNFKSSQSQPPARKVKALYDFEAAEDNELTFFAGEIFDVTDDSNPNWWKGQNQRGEGLFPANFVTTDLNAEPDVPTSAKSSKKIAFDDKVSVALFKRDSGEFGSEPSGRESSGLRASVEIDEAKIDRLLHLLHEADPEDASHDTEEMRDLEDQVNAMGPLIDTELETVDKEHAQLTQLSTQLVEALNMYHTLMKEPMPSGGKLAGSYPMGVNYQQVPGAMPPMYNGMSPPYPQQYPPQYMPQPQYNMPPYQHQTQVPNSMGPMYPGMQPPHRQYQPNSQASMSLPPNLAHHHQPNGGMPTPGGSIHPPVSSHIPQSPPIHHLPHQPHSLPNQMSHNHQLPPQGQMPPQNHQIPAQSHQMAPQGHQIQGQIPQAHQVGQMLPQGHQVSMPPQGHVQRSLPPQGPMSHPSQLPHQHSLPNQSVPQNIGLPLSPYPGPPLNVPMAPTHMPQL